MRCVIVVDRAFGVVREILALLAPPDQGAERAVADGNAGEAAVEQRIGNAGLLLHAVGERDVGRVDAADIENQIGLEREHDLEIGGVAAPGDAPDLRPPADVGQQELALLRTVGARPAEQKLGCQRVEHDRGRRPGREDTRDARRHRHSAAGTVGHAGGAGAARDHQRGRQSGDQCAAIEAHAGHSLALPCGNHHAPGAVALGKNSCSPLIL